MQFEGCYCAHFLVVNLQFSEAEIALYTKRLENGYDLHDLHYEKWLCWRGDGNVSPDPPAKGMDHVANANVNVTLEANNIPGYSCHVYSDMHLAITFIFRRISTYWPVTTITICFN